MAQDFRVSPLENGTSERVKIYTKDNEGLPIDIDWEKRYSVLFTRSVPFLERIRNFEVRKDDIWVITMPKCGTTWMLELVWLLVNDLDYKTALTVEQEVRTPFLEFSAIYPKMLPVSIIEVAEQMKSPRVIKSHLPMQLLPKSLWTVKPKMIYVARDPKDAIISYYHFMNALGNNKLEMEEFLNAAMNNKIQYQPFWNHVVEFWKLRNESYVYFTSFERMKKDLKTIVQQVSKFLQKPICDAQMGKLLTHLSFEQMKNNPMCNFAAKSKSIQEYNKFEENNSFRFIRKGEVGSYKEEISQDMIKKFEDWTERELSQFGVSSEKILFS